MRAGRRTRYVEIQTPTESINDYGGVSESWATHAYAYANIDDVNSPPSEKKDEEFKEGYVTTIKRITFTVNYIGGVTTKMRVVYNGNNYSIEAVYDRGDRRRELQLLTKAEK